MEPEARSPYLHGQMASLLSTVATHLKQLRSAAGLTQADLAERCGIDTPEISKYENGHRVPTLATIERLAEALDVSPMRLFPATDADGLEEACGRCCESCRVGTRPSGSGYSPWPGCCFGKNSPRPMGELLRAPVTARRLAMLSQ
jgi:DNA-binding XRE family transcriptional regulator